MDTTDQQHPDVQSTLDYHAKASATQLRKFSEATNEAKIASQIDAGVSVFPRHKTFDVVDPKNVTGMEKMRMTQQSSDYSNQFRNSKYGAFNNDVEAETLAAIRKKNTRYKDPNEECPQNPKSSNQWMTNPSDLKKLSDNQKKTPIFNAKPQMLVQAIPKSQQPPPAHSPPYVEDRNNSIDEFQNMVVNVHQKDPANQMLESYTNRLEQRLRYIRHKRHSVANNLYPKNEDIIVNSVGSAIDLKEVGSAEQYSNVRHALEKANFQFATIDLKKKRSTLGNRNNSLALTHDPNYKDVAEKFNRPIQSVAFQQYQSDVNNFKNTLEFRQSTQLLNQLVTDTKSLGRNDVSHTDIKTQIEREKAINVLAATGSSGMRIMSPLSLDHDGQPAFDFLPNTTKNSYLRKNGDVKLNVASSRSIQLLSPQAHTMAQSPLQSPFAAALKRDQDSVQKIAASNMSSRIDMQAPELDQELGNIESRNSLGRAARQTQFSFGTIKHEEIDTTKLSKHKYQASESRQYLVDRSYTTADSAAEVSPKPMGLGKQRGAASLGRNILIKGELDPIEEELARKTFKEKFSKIKRQVDTKMLGGGPLYPIAAQHEKKIVDLDTTCAAYKAKYREGLEKAWAKTLQITQAYKFDEKLNQRASARNLPGSRNQGYRVGVPLVRDDLVQEVQDCKLKEVYERSYFTRLKKSPRGFKDGPISLVRGEQGGFRHVGRPNSRLDLEKVLDQFTHIKEGREKYRQSERRGFKPLVTWDDHVERDEIVRRAEIENELDAEAVAQFEEGCRDAIKGSPTYSPQGSPGLTGMQNSHTLTFQGSQGRNSEAQEDIEEIRRKFAEKYEEVDSKLVGVPTNKASMAF